MSEHSDEPTHAAAAANCAAEQGGVCEPDIGRPCDFCAAECARAVEREAHPMLTLDVPPLALLPRLLDLLVPLTCGPEDEPSTEVEKALCALESELDEIDDVDLAPKIDTLRGAVWAAMVREVAPLHAIVKEAGRCVCPTDAFPWERHSEPALAIPPETPPRRGEP